MAARWVAEPEPEPEEAERRVPKRPSTKASSPAGGAVPTSSTRVTLATLTPDQAWVIDEATIDGKKVRLSAG